MKALIVRLSSIGDVVHTLPVLDALHRGGWEVGWVVEPAALPLLAGQPELAQVVRAPSARAFRPFQALAAIRALREREYDVALDLQGLWKSAAWARFSGAPRLLGFASRWRREPTSAMLVSEPVEQAADLSHVIDKNLALLRPLGIQAVGSRAFPMPSNPDRADGVRHLLSANGITDYVVLNPGGGWTSKTWPPEHYGAVARALAERGIRCVVTWGPGEEMLAERVVRASLGTALRCFPTTLLDYVELARRARLVVAADTGPLHIACALGTPVVGIFGPTDPARNGPFALEDGVVRRTPLCSPCHKRRCATHAGVMDAIPIGDVLRAVEKRLGVHVPLASHAV